MGSKYTETIWEVIISSPTQSRTEWGLQFFYDVDQRCWRIQGRQDGYGLKPDLLFSAPFVAEAVKAPKWWKPFVEQTRSGPSHILDTDEAQTLADA